MTYTQTTLFKLLIEEGFRVKNEVLVPWDAKDDFQRVLDFVDCETGEVYSFTVIEGTTDAFACCSQALEAYNKNLIISVNK